MLASDTIVLSYTIHASLSTYMLIQVLKPSQQYVGKHSVHKLIDF